jgi:hypothetical protein
VARWLRYWLTTRTSIRPSTLRSYIACLNPDACWGRRRGYSYDRPRRTINTAGVWLLTQCGPFSYLYSALQFRHRNPYVREKKPPSFNCFIRILPQMSHSYQ